MAQSSEHALGAAPPVAARRWTLPRPDHALAWGTTWAVLGLLVILPLATVAAKASEAGIAGMVASLSNPIALSALALSFSGALGTALVNTLMGTVIAWVLARYDFFGKAVANAVIDLPFALPTAVAGITLSELLSPRGWVGSLHPSLAVSFSPAGVLVAMMFVSLPFAVRAVQPVMQELDGDVEEAAALLGATPWKTFVHVVLPVIRPAMLTGLALSFARSVGEYGSVVIISGNIPLSTLTGPVLIFQRIEEYDTVSATGIAVVMLVASLATLITINLVQYWGGRRG